MGVPTWEFVRCGEQRPRAGQEPHTVQRGEPIFITRRYQELQVFQGSEEFHPQTGLETCGR